MYRDGYWRKIKQLFNVFVEDLVHEHVRKGENIQYVDLQTIQYPADFQDWVHPNAVGFQKMGEAWVGAIMNTIGPYSTLSSLQSSIPSTASLSLQPSLIPTKYTYSPSRLSTIRSSSTVTSSPISTTSNLSNSIPSTATLSLQPSFNVTEPYLGDNTPPLLTRIPSKNLTENPSQTPQKPYQNSTEVFLKISTINPSHFLVEIPSQIPIQKPSSERTPSPTRIPFVVPSQNQPISYSQFSPGISPQGMNFNNSSQPRIDKVEKIDNQQGKNSAIRLFIGLLIGSVVVVGIALVVGYIIITKKRNVSNIEDSTLHLNDNVLLADKNSLKKDEEYNIYCELGYEVTEEGSIYPEFNYDT